MLKTAALSGLAVLFAASLSSAQPSSPGKPGPATAPEAEAVKSAELARFKAMTSNDLKALNASLGDDLIYTHSNALVDSKASYVESISSGRLKYTTIEPRDLQVRVYGHSAIITGAASITSTSNGTTSTNNLRFTDVWVLRDGRWQMVGWQSTRIPAQ
ncbi:MAG TPA: nuclear transport factor 2 family protein [Luteitalea sp.]|nr:nuclear transport factor 2 family protein [Luteitalea sp.]